MTEKHPWLERCPSTHLGVPCRRVKGHLGKHGGIERGRREHWLWSNNPDDELITSKVGWPIFSGQGLYHD
jgi:hypothetical protein